MKIAALGTGSVGRSLAGALATLGHEVVVGTRDPEKTLSRQEPDAMGRPPFAQWHAQHPKVSLAAYPDAAEEAEIIINATNGAASMAALGTAGAANLAGKVLVDVANPLDFSLGLPPSLNPVNTDSLGHSDVIDLGDITSARGGGGGPADLAASLERFWHHRVQFQDREMRRSGESGWELRGNAATSETVKQFA